MKPSVVTDSAWVVILAVVVVGGGVVVVDVSTICSSVVEEPEPVPSSVIPANSAKKIILSFVYQYLSQNIPKENKS